MAATTSLPSLPSDARRHIWRFCDLASLLPLCAVCHELNDDLSRDELWETCMHIHLASVAKAFFDGVLPPPAAGRSWRQHAVALLGKGEVSWLNLARQHSGRKLVRLHVASTKLSKFGYKPFGAQFYGVPWHMVDAHERDSFIVADVTAFAPIHPGSELLLAEALAAHDATELFDAANHSGRARRLLRNMVVPVDVPGADPLGLCRSMTLWESAQSAVVPRGASVSPAASRTPSVYHE